MRVVAILILSLSVLPASAQEEEKEKKQDIKVPEGWIRGESKRYIILTENDKKLLKQYKVIMELLFDQYAKAFGFKGKLEKKAVVWLYKDRESFVAGESLGSAVAYYDPSAKKLVSYRNRELLQFIAHEATHQFFDLAFPEFFNNKDVPMWFSEGLAECFCNCSLRGRKIMINDVYSINAYRNIKSIQNDLEMVQHVPIRKMLDMSPEDFMAKADTLYAQSWSFCHFLWNYPKINGKGKYFKAMLKLIDAFKKGRKRKEAYAEAFGNYSIPGMEAEWKRYVRKVLKAHRPKGYDE